VVVVEVVVVVVLVVWASTVAQASSSVRLSQSAKDRSIDNMRGMESTADKIYSAMQRHRR
jgi:predicted metal-binding membrane protein